MGVLALLLLPGRWTPDCDDIEARLFGRLLLGASEVDTPKDIRLTPGSRGAVMDEVVEPDARFLALLRVTLFGMVPLMALPFRGLPRGGVPWGAGSFDLAE